MSEVQSLSGSTAGRQKLSSFYVLKALLALVVVACHAPIGLPWFQIPGTLVELFFGITGYFLFSTDLSRVQKHLWSTVRKVIPIILFLQIFYNLIAPSDIGNPIDNYSIWIRWIFLGFNSFLSGHLWYLTALFYGLIFFSAYLKVLRGRWVAGLFLLIIPGALIGPFRPILFGQEESIFVFNFLTRAVPFLAMGYWIHANEERLLSYRWLSIYVGLFVLSIGEGLLWSLLFGRDQTASILTLFPIPFALFMLFLSNKTWGQHTFLETIGEKYSGNIYYFHMAVILVWKMLNPYSPSLEQIYNQGGALVVFLISLGIAWLIVRLQDRLEYHLLK